MTGDTSVPPSNLTLVGKDVHVLINLDDAQIRPLAGKFLLEHGCEVTTVFDRREMRQALKLRKAAMAGSSSMRARTTPSFWSTAPQTSPSVSATPMTSRSLPRISKPTPS